MPLRLSLLPLALLLGAPALASAASAAPVRFIVTGSVTEPGGRPVPGARIALEGVPGAAVVADAEGRFALSHEAPAVTLEAPLRLVVRARHRGWNLALPSGASALAVELRRVATGDSARLEVRAGDAAVAQAVARALAAGEGAVVALEARFTRLVGREDRSAPVLSALATVTLAVRPPPAAAAGPVEAPVATAPPERPESMRLFPRLPETAVPVAVAPPAPDTALRPGIRVLVRPEPVAPVAADTVAAPGASPLRVALGRAVPTAPAPVAECGCRLRGTVEVRPGRPVRGRTRVEVSLAGLPAPRDTVTLFMGPPRAFDLGLVPCGRRALEVRPLGPRRFARVEPDSTAFDCVAGGARWFRVVLEPR
jgi:hypothetical protein